MNDPVKIEESIRILKSIQELIHIRMSMTGEEHATVKEQLENVIEFLHAMKSPGPQRDY